LIGLAGFQFPDLQVLHTLDDRQPEKFKMDYVNRAFEAIVTSIRQGKFRSQLTHTLAHLDRLVKPPIQYQ
jgi:hypothetical protein